MDAALAAAVTHATLRRVGRGELPAGIRLYRPAAAVGFGRLDRRLPGFGDACDAALAHGFEPVLRVVGGHAAAHDRESLVLEQFSVEPHFATDIEPRFRAVAEPLRAALASLGVDARIGALSGEYCPGDFGLNAAGATKVVGIAQRVVVGA